nr:hypothetical protein [Mycoplasmopsis bovis]
MHLDVLGNENIRVLRYGFLNSYYQTGLKNLLDLSIINKTDELSDIHWRATKYRKCLWENRWNSVWLQQKENECFS